MTEDFVSFSLAKKLNEKGFNLHCMPFYALENFIAEYVDSCGDCYEVDFEKDILYLNYPLRYKKFEEKMLPAPTISQALKWLRKEHKVYIEPCILVDADTDADGKVINEYIYWSFSVTNIETGDMIYVEYEHVDDKRFDSYEQAAIEGIKYVIDNLI